jgi:ribosomal protein L37AE/L43A
MGMNKECRMPQESAVDRLRGFTRSSKQCSFCEKTADRVERLFSGVHDAYICNECVDYYHHLLQEIASGAVDTKSGTRTTRTEEA